MSLDLLDHSSSTGLACELCRSTVAPIIDLPDDGWSRTPLCHKCRCTLQKRKIKTKGKRARFRCVEPAVFAGRCTQCLHGAPATLRRYQQSGTYQERSPLDPPHDRSDLDERPRPHASISVTLPVITQGALTFEIPLRHSSGLGSAVDLAVRCIFRLRPGEADEGMVVVRKADNAPQESILSQLVRQGNKHVGCILDRLAVVQGASDDFEEVVGRELGTISRSELLPCYGESSLSLSLFSL